MFSGKIMLDKSVQAVDHYIKRKRFLKNSEKRYCMKQFCRACRKLHALAALGLAFFGGSVLAELPAPFSGISFKGNLPEEQNVVFKNDFDSGSGGYAKADWRYQYSGPLNVQFDSGAALISVDYAKDSGNDYSKAGGISVWYTAPVSHGTIGIVKMDVYFDSAALESAGGKLGIEFFIKCEGSEEKSFEALLDPKEAKAVSGPVKMFPVEIEVDSYDSLKTNQIAVLVVGHKTGYKGAVALDNLRVISQERADNSIVSTVKPSAQKAAVRAEGGAVVTAADSVPLPREIQLADKDADDSAKTVYAYLSAMGKSSSVIYGHQNDIWRKAGSPSLSDSDTQDVTGSIAGVVGIDALSLTGNEYSAREFNAKLGKKLGKKLPETLSGNVAAAALLTNEAISEGAVVTLSAHMPNFKIAAEKGMKPASRKAPYERYDFSGYTPGVSEGDIMNSILPGGTYSKIFTAYLDMIADYASQVEGAVLFRPFHENTGSWFWWGKAFCDAETFKNVYRFTADYLKNEKGVHNVIYVYSPGAEASSVEEYAQRYPGDEYVDIVGFDMYHDDPAPGDSFFAAFKAELGIVQEFARQHNKLLAVTETGIRTTSPEKGHNQTALRSTGNKVPDWYGKMLEAVSSSDASYFLLWANFGKRDGYYSPYVNEVTPDGFLKGHEMLDPFVSFYNDRRSVFASQQKDALSAIDAGSIQSVRSVPPSGYITAPVAGERLLRPAVLSARLNGIPESASVQFLLSAEEEIAIPAVKKGFLYTAKLGKKELARLGRRNGTVSLVADGAEMQQIRVLFNIEEPKENPLLVDSFESYLGDSGLLEKKWNTNKASGSGISISLDSGNKNSGGYGMKFSYSETSDGWAGATVGKSADWSRQNAVQFWTKPDGNNQKVVFQIVANKKTYEVYLQEYSGYRDRTEPVLVTVPFAEFCERDAPGKPKGGLGKDSGKIEQIGLWVNAIDGTPAVKNGSVSGTIYYDDIKAVKADGNGPSFE